MRICHFVSTDTDSPSVEISSYALCWIQWLREVMHLKLEELRFMVRGSPNDFHYPFCMFFFLLVFFCVVLLFSFVKENQ